MFKDNKKIHWLVPFKLKEPKDITFSNLASVRLRTALFNQPIFNEYTLSINESIDDENKIDYLFISKLSSDREDLLNDWIKIINNHRDNNKKLFFDYTDHHLSNESVIGEFYRQAIKPEDHIVTSSEKLKKYLTSKYRKVTIIPDPIEINIQNVKKNKKSSFLFFGHHKNLKYLFKLFANWSNEINTDLLILTSPEGINGIKAESQNIYKPPNLNVQFQLWSLENMLKASDHVSGIIIPGDINDERKNGVSHNRLITAFALGLPVAATRYESYLEFDHQFVDIDNRKEFENFIKNPSIYSSRVEMAQKKVKSYSRDKIALKWLDLIK